ncbi:MBOAT family protein [Candidatus Bariatricus faecipullorum]
MSFSSILFIFIFLPVMLVIYYVAPRFLKNGVLLLGSLVFYAWGDPVYVILLFLSVLFNYFSGLDIARKQGKKRARMRSMLFAVCVNLLILGFFKYYGFLTESLNRILPFDIPVWELAAPLGISYFTFQALSYIWDVYRGMAPVQTGVLKLGLYLAMFPQITSGPIVKYRDIAPQIEQREESLGKFGQGIMIFVVGLSKKLLLANTLGQVHTYVAGLSPDQVSVLTAWVGCLAYTFQIYFDFGGYSDMARGIGKMFGFELPRNFDYPYLSKSVTEFWRRWHMSLGQWFRDYVYIPMGGNRVSVPRHLLNLLAVWFLTGLWHGAGWNFIVWGLYYGVVLILEKYLYGRFLEKLPAGVCIVYNMLLVMAGWVLFFSPDISGALAWLGRMAGIGAAGIVDSRAVYLLKTNWLFWAAAIVGSTPVVKRMYLLFAQDGKRTRPVAGALILAGLFFLCIAYLVTESYQPFLYVQF